MTGWSWWPAAGPDAPGVPIVRDEITLRRCGRTPGAAGGGPVTFSRRGFVLRLGLIRAAPSIAELRASWPPCAYNALVFPVDLRILPPRSTASTSCADLDRQKFSSRRA